MIDAHTQLAVWLQREHPKVFASLYAQAKKAGLGSLGDDWGDIWSGAADAVDSGAGDASFTDLNFSAPSASDINSLTAGSDLINTSSFDFNTPGGLTPPSLLTSAPSTLSVNPSAVSSAAQTVGNFLTSNNGILALTRGAAAIATATQAANVINTQAQRAAAGQAPANVVYQPVQNPNTGIITAVPTLAGSPLSSAQISALAPSNQNLLVYLGLGALALLYITG